RAARAEADAGRGPGHERGPPLERALRAGALLELGLLEAPILHVEEIELVDGPIRADRGRRVDHAPGVLVDVGDDLGLRAGAARGERAEAGEEDHARPRIELLPRHAARRARALEGVVVALRVASQRGLEAHAERGGI